jgi:Ca-activated chloride channel family protein
MFINQLDERDRVAIVVYAGATGLVLPSTTCNNQATILAALDKLEAGGSTNGGAGIELAYTIAQQELQPEGINRVILCTDGDFNVGVTSQGELTRLIEEKRKAGVFLTVLGFGMGNYQDSTLENLADKGNGNYAYIDTIHEARKVLVEQLGGTLVTIAKDVKIQVDFNPAKVAAYRLIGYENRLLRNEDFHDDTKDAGEIGAGHTVTALYELVPPGAEEHLPKVDPSMYQTTGEVTEAASGDEWLTIKLRYKEATADESQLLSFPVSESTAELASTSSDFRFAAGVAAFGMLLRESPYRGQATYDQVLELAAAGRADDKSGYRAEFVQLVHAAKALGPRMAKQE